MTANGTAEHVTEALQGLLFFALVPLAVCLRLAGNIYAATVLSSRPHEDPRRAVVDPSPRDAGQSQRKRIA